MHYCHFDAIPEALSNQRNQLRRMEGAFKQGRCCGIVSRLGRRKVGPNLLLQWWEVRGDDWWNRQKMSVRYICLYIVKYIIIKKRKTTSSMHV